MTVESLEQLLMAVGAGSLSVDEAVNKLRELPFVSTAGSLVDTHREIRQGFPEVVFARNKTKEETLEAFQALYLAHGYALATHVPEEVASFISAIHPDGVYDARSKVYALGKMKDRHDLGKVAVVWAGTSDVGVANEAALTLEFAGVTVDRHHDVGVAGLHRLLSRLDSLRNCRVIIAVAGMEGALPGVMAGLLPAPIIAVPTSVGYGTGTGGKAALLSMLNACAGGLGVVNIDNGFGAALLAFRILKSSQLE